MPKPTEVALDTCVILNLAGENRLVIECLETLRAKIPNLQIVVLPTVIQELTNIADTGEMGERELALKALASIRGSWGFLPVNCIPVGHGIVEQTGRKIRDKQLLPEEEIHDSFVIAEAGLRDVSILLSSDTHIKDIDCQELKLLLDSCDICCPLIASPRKVVAQFSPRREKS